MSKYTFTESNYEQAIIELFRDQLGYEYIYGPDIERDYAEPLFLERLQQSLLAINPSLPEVAIHEAIEKIRQIDTGSLVQRNEVFTDYLQNGVDVAYFKVALKALGIGYVTGFAADICRDAGQTSLASITETVGRCGIFLLSLPLVLNVVDLALGFIT